MQTEDEIPTPPPDIPPDDLADEIVADRAKARRTVAVAAAFLLLAAVFMLAFWNMMQGRNDTAVATYDSVTAQQQAKLDEFAANQQELLRLANELNKQLVAKGGDPLPVPEAVETDPPPPPMPRVADTPPPPPKGEKGDPPSPAEIAIAVSSFCRDTGECKADDGKPGANGKNATPEQIAAAISTYCTANGDCKGEKGDQGDGPSEAQILAGLTAYCADGRCQGPKGNDGERGPGPTDEQIAAAVADYCAAHDDCKGNDGEPGDDSTVPGPPGRGIERSVCEDGRWTNHYTDGTQDDAGSCAPAPAPTVTETVTATPEPTDDPT
jgi:hypothetical protein